MMAIKVDYNSRGLFLSQSAYEKKYSHTCIYAELHANLILIELKSNLSLDDGDLIEYPNIYISLWVLLNIRS